MSVMLHAIEYGEGPPVAILHGLFGSGRNWGGIAQRLGAHHRAIAFDLRNHGASPWAETTSYAEMAEDVRAGMRARGHRRYALIGHSMGGKVAMVAALTVPAAVERLIVVDIAPVAYPMRYLAYVRAMRALELGPGTRRRDVDAQLAGVVRSPAERAFLQQSLVFGDGSPRWRLNLAALEGAMPELAAFPAVPNTASYPGPALFVAGDRSDAVTPEREAVAAALFPNAGFARIGAAGHWVHADQPEALLALIEPFLALGHP